MESDNPDDITHVPCPNTLPAAVIESDTIEEITDVPRPNTTSVRVMETGNPEDISDVSCPNTTSIAVIESDITDVPCSNTSVLHDRDEELSDSNLSFISTDELEDDFNEEEQSNTNESAMNQDTLFDVLDYVEEPFDENVEELSSDEDVPNETAQADDTKAFDFENDELRDEVNDEERENYEECEVIDVPKNLDEVSPLPDGWKAVYHESGALLYWQPRTNVCSLSRPYFLGAGSTKSHALPEAAIPCLYHRNLPSETDAQPDSAASQQQSAASQPESAAASQKKISDYCKRLFKLKTIKYLKFRSWDVRRNYLRTLRNERNRRKLHLTNNKFISFPIIKRDLEGKILSNKKWIITPRGRSYVAILHEYLQQSLKTHPVYSFKEVDNAKTPYAATVIVNGDEYGSGVGMSKKDAKLEAAKATLLVLLPKMKKDILSTEEKEGRRDNDSEEEELNIASIFDDIAITDPRVTKLSKRTTEPTPYELLVKCLQKKNDKSEIKFDLKVESEECTMSVGEHTVTVRCDNKRDGKQLAAQSLLKALHPYIENWGSLLRLYGNHTNDQYQFGSSSLSEEKNLEEVVHHSSPNKKLLSRLRNRMVSLKEDST